MHTSETNEEDGVILFSVEQLLQGQLRPDIFISLGYYEYAFVYSYSHKKPFPETPTDGWKIIETLTGIEKDAIIKFTGFEEPNLWAALTSVYFRKAVTFKQSFPETYNRLKEYYGMDTFILSFIVVKSLHDNLIYK